MKLNLGAGYKKYPGYVSVDAAPECKPDIVWDLEVTPWPWEEGSIDEIKLEHTLEHLGETTRSYAAIWKEMWRVCRNDAFIYITVPHWTHENFYHDPTHVRPITPVGIQLLDQARNIAKADSDERESTLGLFWGIDIELLDSDVEYFYTGKIADAYNAGEFSYAQLEHLRDHQNNIANEVRMKARVVKPARGAQWLVRRV